MALRLDFARIREHRGTQMGGFEELCCQLAALEDPVKGARFVRKGQDGPTIGTLPLSVERGIASADTTRAKEF